MALLIPFLNSTILFSYISSEFKMLFEKEIFGCMTYVGIDHNTLWDMPVFRRKFYISMHNEKIKEANEKSRVKNSKNKK